MTVECEGRTKTMRKTMYILFALLLMIRRVFLISLPFFWHSSKSNLTINLVVGALSDVSLLSAIIALGLLLNKWPGRRFGVLVWSVLAAAIAFYCAIEIRYVEHFGLTPRPYHLVALNTGEVWIAGAKMLTETWRAAILLAFSAAFILMGLKAGASSLTDSKSFAGVLVALVVAAGCHSAMINLRQKPGIVAELRYNPLVALHYNFKSGSIASAAIASQSELLAARRFFSPRAFLDEKYPMWQSALSHNNSGTPASDTAVEKYLEQEKPNVIVIISESLRAKELFTPRSGVLLFPGIAKLIGEGLFFSNVFAAGNATHYGQSAINCSVYGAKNFTLIHDVPLNKARCLTDVFKARGYETGFYYGGDNHFDNQQEFYSFHGTDNIYGSADLAEHKAHVHGGWGFSDKSLYDFTLEKLKTAKKPFFGVVLSLTNHAPYVLPEDAPAEIAGLPLVVREKISRYVDWSTSAFIRQISVDFPDTLVVLTADHGMFWDDPVREGIPDEELLRSIARVPLLMVGGPLKAGYRGKTVPTLGSSVDIGPTLLSILGWDDEPNQFMGENILQRTFPVYMDWRDTLITIRPGPGGLEIGAAESALVIALRTLLQNNQLAPNGVPH